MGEEQNNIVEMEGVIDMSAFDVAEGNPEGGEQTAAATEQTEKPAGSTEENIQTGESQDGAESVAGGQEEGGEESEQGSPNYYSSFASALQSEGLLASLDLEKTEIKDVNDLIGAVKQEIQSNEYKDLNEDQKQYLTALREGVPVEEFKEAKSVEAQLLAIKPEQLEAEPELRKAVLVQDFIDNGATPERAESFAEMLVKEGKDVEEAGKALTSVQAAAQKEVQKQIEKAQEANKAKTKEIENYTKGIDKGVDDTTEIIEGMVINEKLKSTIKNSILKPVDSLPDGTQINALQKDRLDNPVEFDIKLHYMYNITKGFTDFSALTNKAKTNAVNDFDALLKGNTFVQGQDNQDISSLINQADGNGFSNISDSVDFDI